MEHCNKIKPKLKDFAGYALPTPGWYLPLGLLLELIAWTIIALGLYYVYFLIETKRGGVQLLLSLIPLIFGLILSPARSLQVNTCRKLLDPREPILYLRPFFHERAQGEIFSYSQSPYSTLIQLFLFFKTGHVDSVKTSDEAIAKALKTVGPVISVGMPQETLPPPGSLRLYFKDEEWREKVDELMRISKLVIIQPGYTSNLEWEMYAAKQHFRPEQICFSLLDWSDLNKKARKFEFEVFSIQIERIYGISLPEHFSNAYLIYFDNNWNPAKVTVDWWVKIYLFMAFEIMSTTAIRQILKPVLQRQEIKLSMWRTVVFIVLTHSIYGIVLYYFINRIFRH